MAHAKGVIGSSVIEQEIVTGLVEPVLKKESVVLRVGEGDFDGIGNVVRIVDHNWT